MRYLSPESFRSGVEARLKSSLSGSQADLLRARRIVVFERTFARLAVNDPGSRVLKGGAALEFRLNDRARATKDVDDVAFIGDEPPQCCVRGWRPSCETAPGGSHANAP